MPLQGFPLGISEGMSDNVRFPDRVGSGGLSPAGLRFFLFYAVKWYNVKYI